MYPHIRTRDAASSTRVHFNTKDICDTNSNGNNAP